MQEFAKSMLELYKYAALNDITIIFDSMENESLITRARCVFVGRFLSSPLARDFTHFMFIDADIEFSVDAVIRLLNSENEVSVACYPKKNVNFESAKNEVIQQGGRSLDMASADLVVNVGSDKRSIVNGFVEIMDGPTGFMMIKREVLEKMRDFYPELRCINDHANKDFDEFPALFDCMIDPISRRYLSEDYAFCRRWQKMGGKIHGDVNTVLGHVGNLTFGGNMGTRKIYSSKEPEVPPMLNPTLSHGWGFLAVSINRQIPVRTLSILITFSAQLIRQGVQSEIVFTSMDERIKQMHLAKCMMTYDTTIFLDYGVSFDIMPIMALEWQNTSPVMVIPSIRPVLDWDRFTDTCRMEDGELLQHKAIVYDTTFNDEDLKAQGKTTIYSVKNSDSRILFIDNTKVKGCVENFIKDQLPQHRWVSFFKKNGITVGGIRDINTTNTLYHKCLSGLGKSNSTRVIRNG